MNYLNEKNKKGNEKKEEIFKEVIKNLEMALFYAKNTYLDVDSFNTSEIDYHLESAKEGMEEFNNYQEVNPKCYKSEDFEDFQLGDILDEAILRELGDEEFLRSQSRPVLIDMIVEDMREKGERKNDEEI